MNKHDDIVRSIEHLVDAKTKAEAALQEAWGTTQDRVNSAYAYAYGMLRSSIEIEVQRLRALVTSMESGHG